MDPSGGTIAFARKLKVIIGNHGMKCIALKNFIFYIVNLLFIFSEEPSINFFLILGNCFENNVDRPHRGRVHIKNSATACQLLCQEVEFCKYFTWRKDNRECWLKNEKGTADHNENAISGPKLC